LPLGHLGHFTAQGVPHLDVGFVLETREVDGSVEYGGNARVLVRSDKARQKGVSLQVTILVWLSFCASTSCSAPTAVMTPSRMASA
jgi:hypothetical protein